MKKSRFSDEQIVHALRQVEAGVNAGRKLREADEDGTTEDEPQDDE